MDFGNLAQMGSFATALAALVISIVNARSSRNNSKIDSLEKDYDALDSRMTRVETDLQHLPDKDSANRMEVAIARLEGRLEALDERLKPVAAMAGRMQDLMLEGRTR